MRKKVLIITPFEPGGVGGAETFTSQLILEVRDHVHAHLLTCPPLKKAWDNPSMLECFKKFIYLLPRAIYFQRKNKYNALHCLGIIATGVGAILKKLFGIKLITTMLANYDVIGWPLSKRMIVSWVLNQADTVLVEDRFMRKNMLQLHIPNQKIKEFVHWVDLEKFKPVKYTHKDLRVLFIGRPIIKKGKHIIQEVEEEMKARELKVRFTYVENIPYKDLPGYYQRADVFVIPSLYDEGVARVVLEAAASGCAVISSSYGSLRELVKPFGLVVPPDVEAFRQKILALYMDERLLKAYKQASRVYAMQHFSKKNAEVFLNEY